MNLWRVAPLVTLLLAPLARAADECLIDPKVIKPQFSPRLPKGFKLVSSKKEKKPKQMKEVLKLADGYEVTVTVGGCTSLTFTLGIKGPGLNTKTVGAELVAITKRVLPTLPMDKDSTVDVKLLIQAIDEARINVMPAQLPCGAATCQLSLEADEVKPKATKGKKPKKDEPAPEPAGVLKLSYDLPLSN